MKTSKSTRNENALFVEEPELQGLLEAVTLACVGGENAHDLYETLCRIFLNVDGITFAWVGLRSGGTLHPVARGGDDRGYLDGVLITAIEGDAFAQGPTGVAILTNSVQVVNSIMENDVMKPWHEASSRVGFASSAAVPLSIDGEVIASLGLYSGEANRFSVAFSELLEKVATIVSFALSHYDKRVALRDLSDVTTMRDYALARISHGLVITDATLVDNPITFVNSSFEQLTGYRSNEVIGKNCRFLQGPDTDPEAVRRIRDSLASTTACDIDLVNYRKGGEPFWNHLSLFPFFNDENHLHRWVGVLSDISDRQRLEGQLAQSQKLEAIGTLAGGIAHDFNNLLLVIQGYASMIATSTTDQQHLAATRIEEAVRRGARLTRQLLAYSRQQTHRPQLLSLDDAITEAIELLEPMLRPGISLRTSLHSPVGYALLDPSQVQQCIVNLVANAVEAMPKGGTIQVLSRVISSEQARSLRFEADDEHSYVTLEVIDNGTGMDEETKKRIFEPFYTTKSTGTGLGLASVYGIVRQSYGHVRVESTVGTGTTFRIYFPLAPPSVPQSDAAPRLAKQPAEDGDVVGDETVLIVEGNEEARHLLATALRSHGFEVLQASSGGEAIAASEVVGPIDVLLSNINMADMDGRELANRMLVERPNLRVIFTSGSSAGALRQKDFATEDFVVIEKPYQSIHVARTIRQLLDASFDRPR